MNETHEAPAKQTSGYARTETRSGRLPFSTKLFQGMGAIPEALKGFAFNTFLLIYYDQVLGLPAAWASVALAAGVLVDAVTDPMVGSLSDRMVSRLGRRHLLMYASVLPLAATLYLLFSPPPGLEGAGLLAWLIVFAVGSRVSMTFFQVPWSALFVELTDDYVERSEVVTYRWALGILGVAAFTAFTWSVVFPDGEGAGQLERAPYARFAPILALTVAGFALASTLLTQREVRYLLQPVTAVGFSLRAVLSDLTATLRNTNFRLLFVGLLMSATLTGTAEAMRIYLATYFWELTPGDLRWYALAAIGAFAALFCVPFLNRRFDKRTLLIVGMMVSILDGFVVITLRLTGVLPENGEPSLLVFLVANEVFRAYLLVIIGTMFVSMAADTVDEQELVTGRRQEGVFSAAVSFSGKAISGLGIIFAGLLLQYVVALPDGVRPDTMPEDVRLRLGLVMGYLIPALYFVPLLLLRRYTISRDRHDSIRAGLRLRTEQAEAMQATKVGGGTGTSVT